jgi:predicted alpha/beta superfamily hydrolase
MAISILVFSALITQTRVQSLTGSIEKIENFESKILGNKRNLSIYLPPQYELEPTRKFPVMYLHDGQNVFDGMTSYIPNQEWRADESAEALIKAGLIEPLIIVGVDNADRANEYLPMKITLDKQDIGGRANLFADMMSDELIPMINTRYRTKTGPKHTGTCGASFGGIIASYLGIAKPNVFGKLGICSPSVWGDIKGITTMVKPIEQKAKRAKIWIDVGTAEGDEMVDGAKLLQDAYITNGWKLNKDLVMLVEGNADHSERSWGRRFPLILTYLFPAKPASK